MSHLGTAFFARPAVEVAQDLIGRTLVRTRGRGHTRMVITAVAAHEGGKETAARRGMKYAPGTIFVMPFRGRHFLNISTGTEGEASCVFIRAGIVEGQPREVLDGPAKLAKRLAVNSLDSNPLGSELWIEGEAVSPALVEESIQSKVGDNCLGVFTFRK